MGFKKISYHRGDYLMKVKIEDPSGAKEGNWTFMMSDLGQFVETMHRKYGISREPVESKELDWTG